MWLWSLPKSLVLAAFQAFPPPTINILCCPQTYSALSGLRGGEYGAFYSATFNKQPAQEYCTATFSCFAGVTVVFFLIHARCQIHSIPMIMHKCMLFFSNHGFHFSTFCLSYFVDVLSTNYHLNTAVLMDNPCRTSWIAPYILM